MPPSDDLKIWDLYDKQAVRRKCLKSQRQQHVVDKPSKDSKDEEASSGRELGPANIPGGGAA